MQVDPIKPKLIAPGTNLLTLKYDETLSTFAFNLYLRPYTKIAVDTDPSVVDIKRDGWKFPHHVHYSRPAEVATLTELPLSMAPKVPVEFK